jgi:hypothetical protein
MINLCFVVVLLQCLGLGLGCLLCTFLLLLVLDPLSDFPNRSLRVLFVLEEISLDLGWREFSTGDKGGKLFSQSFNTRLQLLSASLVTICTIFFFILCLSVHKFFSSLQVIRMVCAPVLQ